MAYSILSFPFRLGRFERDTQTVVDSIHTLASHVSVGRGLTAARPANLGYDDAGLMFFDYTLAINGLPIWWNGEIWVDATGAMV